MTRSAGLTGTINVGEAGATPSIQVAVNFTAAATELEVKGKLDLAAAASGTFPQGDITTLRFIKLSSTDKTTGVSKDVVYNFQAAGAMQGMSDVLIISAAAGITSFTYVAGSGNNTIIDYVLAGV